MRRSDGLSSRGRQILRWRTRPGTWASAGLTLYWLVDIYNSAGTVEAFQPKAMRRRAGTRVLPRKAEEIIERAIRFALRGQRRGEEDVVKATNAAPGEYSVSRPLEVVQIDHTEIGQSQIDS